MVSRKNVCKNLSLIVIYWIQQEHVQQFKLKKLKAWSYSGPFLQHHSLCAAVATAFLTSCECSIHSNELWQIIPDLWLWTSLFHSQKQEKTQDSVTQNVSPATVNERADLWTVTVTWSYRDTVTFSASWLLVTEAECLQFTVTDAAACFGWWKPRLCSLRRVAHVHKYS